MKWKNTVNPGLQLGVSDGAVHGFKHITASNVDTLHPEAFKKNR
jgi:hypothetical protein